jgi:hypothetical protein
MLAVAVAVRKLLQWVKAVLAVAVLLVLEPQMLQ